MSLPRLVGAIFAFALLLGISSLAVMHRLDLTATIWLQRAAPAPDLPASVFVFLGDAEVVIPLVALAGLYLWLRDRGRGLGTLWLALALAAVGLLAVALKYTVVHPGPPRWLQRDVMRFGLSVPSPYSLPSGHTARTTFIAGTLLRRAPALAGALVLCMMAALVYLGDHWMTDVAAGLCLGWACTEAARGLRIG